MFGNENPEKKKQHFIPRFYIHNFTDPNGKINVYNCKYKSFSYKDPEQVCYLPYLYETKWREDGEGYINPNYFENQFAEKETQYSSVIKKIISVRSIKENYNSLVCSDSERLVLLNFITNLFLRNPFIIEAQKLNEINVIDELSDLFNAAKKVYDELGWGSAEGLFKFAMKSVFWDDRLDYGMTQKMAKALNELSFSFLACKNMSIHFIFTNVPVILEADEQSNIMLVFLTLSPYCAVILNNLPYWEKNRNRINLIDEDIVKKLNKKISTELISGIDYLYGQTREDILSAINA